MLAKEGYVFDVAYTSRAASAPSARSEIVLDEMDLMWIPVHRSWRLNERHYGALQGLNKAETAAKFGEDQVKIWRRSYDIPPPALTADDERFPGHDPRYAGLSRAGTAAHRVPEGHGGALPAALARDHRARHQERASGCSSRAHGNSLRALVKYLDNVSDADIVELNIPTGMPLVYELDDDLKPLKSLLSRRPREGEGRDGRGRHAGQEAGLTLVLSRERGPLRQIHGPLGAAGARASFLFTLPLTNPG